MNTILSMIHWWLPLGIIIAGVVLFILANRKTANSLRSLGLVIVAIGIFLGIVRYLFPTDQEKCEQATRSLAEAANHQNWKQFESLLDANTTVDLGGRVNFANATGAENIALEAQAIATKIGLEQVQVVSLASTVNERGEIPVSATIASRDHQDLDRPIVTYWQFSWIPKKDGKGFFLGVVKLLGTAESGG